MRGEPLIVKQLLQKAIDSALLAIEYYNKPAVSFKSEGFIVMMCIAWTAFFHAYFLKNKIKPFYRKKTTGKRPRFETYTERLPDGTCIKDKKWWELQKCLKEFFKENNNNPVYKNLMFLSGLRNLIVHRNLPELDASIYAECQASVFNLNDCLKNYFNQKFNLDQFLSFSIQIFKSPKNFLGASKRELKNKDAIKVVDFIKSFRSSLSTEILESPQYSFKAVLIQVKIHESKDALALRFIHEKDLTEEQKEKLKEIGIVLIKEKTIYKDEVPTNYKWTYSDLRKEVKEKLPHITLKIFERYKSYFQLCYNQESKSNQTLVYKRVNNPKSKNPQYTYFYDPKILQEFEKMHKASLNEKKFEELLDKILTAKRQNPQADTSEMEKKIDSIILS